MTKLNRKHGIEVGSKVRVLNAMGDDCYIPFVGKVLTVKHVNTAGSNASHTDDLISCDGVGSSQFATRFEIVETVNGVDAYGKPMLFNDGDLKQMQRVVFANNIVGIVATNGEGKVVVATPNNGWMDANLTCEDTPDWDIVEVYAHPWQNNFMFDFMKRGDLIWKRQEVDIKLNELTEAVEQAEQEYRENMDASIAKVKAAKQALEEYKAK